MKHSTNSPFQSLSLVMSCGLVICRIIKRGECSVLQTSMCVLITNDWQVHPEFAVPSLEVGIWVTLGTELYVLLPCAETAVQWVVCLWTLPCASGSETVRCHQLQILSILTPWCYFIGVLSCCPDGIVSLPTVPVCGISLCLLIFWELCPSEWHTVL